MGLIVLLLGDWSAHIFLAFRFGRPISVETYKEQFFSEDEGAPRAAVKRLTRAIEGELVETSINAPNWYVKETGFYRRCADTIAGTFCTWPGWLARFSGSKRDRSTSMTLSRFLRRELTAFVRQL